MRYSVDGQTAEQNLQELRTHWDNIASPDANVRKKSMRILALQYHPDKGGDSDCLKMINALNDYYTMYYNQKPTQDFDQ